MIEVTDKTDCSGCSACASICTHGCINMVADNEGFLYPQVDTSKCINCGLCNSVCPIENTPTNNRISHVFAAKNKNSQERFNSSSGGVFRLIAEDVIHQHGLVVGCRFNDEMEAIHDIAHSLSELDALMSSKYVQSDTRRIYEEVRNYLKTGRLVLFSGVPCQVAALRNFLFKPYENLILMDILCHGVPSPKFFKEYVASLETRYGSKVTSLNFRWKEKSWKRLYMNVLFKNKRRHFLYAGYDSYMQLFLSDRLQRPSCFNCPYNTLNRPGDISLGDFWGIGKQHYDFDDNKGISMVLINNEKGQDIWNRVVKHTDFIETDIPTAVAGNQVLVRHLPSRLKRDEFYDEYVKNGFNSAICKFAPEVAKISQSYQNFMRWGLDILRKIKKESY